VLPVTTSALVVGQLISTPPLGGGFCVPGLPQAETTKTRTTESKARKVLMRRI